ncbi:phosphate ABC transporter substrate-binding protein [Virgibacillus sp. 179-BFC.A HS]|uniref:Phosphate-binding protein n=1 Tax=Tigheibacillus jepli TaxID=3035914 RepID=A0ABU5CFJ3_9BACI|nr:phosphate ABC transporter substrate-binding protein [Virgibacillus sp. 179-BFC.A HS]MDY0404290.1 phosphate ABC transporter substrate-binding protein [Virgibacillus sp. 179-BFC.A HS]
MKSAKQVLSLLFIAMLVVLAACGNGSANDQSAKDKNKDSASKGGNIVLSGSSALQPLAAAAAEEYMNENTDAQIQVQGGGSGTGLSQVAEGQVDIGNSDVFAEEKEGIPAEELVDHKVAVVGMAPVVNPKVGIEDITKDDLVKVFTGEIKNWKDLGGADQKITLVNRPDSSGTRATFVKYALDGATPAEGITEDSSSRVLKLVNETPGAIGYLAFSYLDDTVTSLKLDGVEATDKNVQSGDYPIWAYEHMYTKGEPSGLAKEFLDYMVSDDVQKNLVPEQGYISATDMQVERDAEGNIK